MSAERFIQEEDDNLLSAQDGYSGKMQTLGIAISVEGRRSLFL